MTREENELPMLDRLFEEAVNRHGGDLLCVVRDVKAQIALLSGADQSAIDRALQRLLAFRAPDFRGRPSH